MIGRILCFVKFSYINNRMFFIFMSAFIGTLLYSLYTNLPSQNSLVYNKVAVPNDTEEIDSPNLIKPDNSRIEPDNSFNYPRKIKKFKIPDGKQHRIYTTCHRKL